MTDETEQIKNAIERLSEVDCSLSEIVGDYQTKAEAEPGFDSHDKDDKTGRPLCLPEDANPILDGTRSHILDAINELCQYREDLRISVLDMPLTNFDTRQSLDLIWVVLHAYREDCIPTRVTTDNNWKTTRIVDDYDKEWDEICTAMAWITDALNAGEPGCPDCGALCDEIGTTCRACGRGIIELSKPVEPIDRRELDSILEEGEDSEICDVFAPELPKPLEPR